MKGLNASARFTSEDVLAYLPQRCVVRAPNPWFWGNIRRLVGLVDEGSLVQYSVFVTGSRRGAMACEMIARHYGASVMVFKGDK